MACLAHAAAVFHLTPACGAKFEAEGEAVPTARAGTIWLRCPCAPGCHGMRLCSPTAPNPAAPLTRRVPGGLEATLSLDKKYCAFPGIINGGEPLECCLIYHTTAALGTHLV